MPAICINALFISLNWLTPNLFSAIRQTRKRRCPPPTNVQELFRIFHTCSHFSYFEVGCTSRTAFTILMIDSNWNPTDEQQYNYWPRAVASVLKLGLYHCARTYTELHGRPSGLFVSPESFEYLHARPCMLACLNESQDGGSVRVGVGI